MLFDTTVAAPPPLTRRESLLEYLTQPRLAKPSADATASEREAYLSGGITIETRAVSATWEALKAAIRENRARNSGHSGVMISGPSTVGKTTIAKALMRKVMDEYVAAYPGWASDGDVPVVYIDVPPAANGKTLMTTMCRFLGLHVATRDTANDLRDRVVTVLRNANTKLIVVDELHNLAARTAGVGEAVDVLKALHNDLQAVFLYAGIDVVNSSLMSGPRGAQISGRFTVQQLEPYDFDSQKKEWRGLINAFERAIDLHDQSLGELRSMEEYLHDRTGGSIGSLRRLLTGMAIELINDPDSPERFDRHRLDSYQLDHASDAHYRRVRAARARSQRTATQAVLELAEVQA